ncbi:MAG: hypothetical protein A3F83_10040 [Candidatus Glassbacteria bacterium RIFCSPLOWO2_12_FULL_58_11]|uniref:Polyprenyl synthetase n=1 Tax=Candidatus Glassbacteria bacterium RIFCSPLOWO2_12_FULL_58_11 TaxID=1817867 RepID=A0A1F5Z342_9BACT|nr:MAG: hypothetical protein A3F83_10040 [Candidatus Glassbacteria bacterium RIFCSPLOWO2_12_FULL_58_11]
MDIGVYLKERKEAVERHLARIVSRWPGPGAPGGELAGAMAYSLEAGGKRLRPILVLAACRACGRDEVEAVYNGACALELLHTYTLIHDDLPVMDDDDFRRGLPTCHRKFGERRALLAGVGLLCAAFEELGRSAGELRLSRKEAGEVLEEVAAALGGGGVVGGQLVDLESERKEIGRETLNYIHSHKTGALLRVSCTLGGRLARADRKKLAALAEYGEQLGLAFQIVDDLLDVEGDSRVLGKTAGADQARGKATFPALYGLVESRKLAAGAVEKSIAALERARLDGEGILGGLAGFVLTRNY